MKTKTWIMIGVMTLAAVSTSLPAQAKLQKRTVEYKHGDTVLEGYLAYDDALRGARPGVMVVHAWMGLNDYARKRADMLAGLGYVAFAADIYGKGVRPQNPKDAGATSGIYRANRTLLRERARAGLEVLRSSPLSDDTRLAAIGYCFGGGTVLELARSGANVAGVVSFHGNLDTPDPADAKNIKAKVLVQHGADDPFVPAEQVAAFHNEMRQAKVDWSFIAYGNAVHSFTEPAAGNDPSQGVAYNAAADRRSWAAMRQFFNEIFKR